LSAKVGSNKLHPNKNSRLIAAPKALDLISIHFNVLSQSYAFSSSA
jgi:hypothetical protein